MKPVIGIAAIAIATLIVFNCVTNRSNTILGCNNLCASVYGGIGIGQANWARSN